MINHMIFPKGDFVPDHHANSHVHMIVVRGNLTLQLDEQEPHHGSAVTKGDLARYLFGEHIFFYKFSKHLIAQCCTVLMIVVYFSVRGDHAFEPAQRVKNRENFPLFSGNSPSQG
jgi:hypothetical protein